MSRNQQPSSPVLVSNNFNEDEIVEEDMETGRSTMTHRSDTEDRQPLIPSSSSNERNHETMRKELYHTVQFTYQLLIIQGIYSYFLDHSLFILLLRVIQSIFYYYCFLSSPLRIVRVLKNFTVTKTIILTLITIIPIMYLHINSFTTATVGRREGSMMRLIDFFEQDNQLFGGKHKMEPILKIGTYQERFGEKPTITFHQDEHTKREFIKSEEKLSEIKSKDANSQTEQSLTSSIEEEDEAIAERQKELDQAAEMESLRYQLGVETYFQTYPHLFLLHVLLFDILFALLQISYISTLIQFKKKFIHSSSSSRSSSNSSRGTNNVQSAAATDLTLSEPNTPTI